MSSRLLFLFPEHDDKRRQLAQKRHQPGNRIGEEKTLGGVETGNLENGENPEDEGQDEEKEKHEQLPVPYSGQVAARAGNKAFFSVHDLAGSEECFPAFMPVVLRAHRQG